MSLINKMLQELDKRQAANGLSAQASKSIADNVQPVARRRVGSDMFWWLMAAMMLAMIGWLGWVMWQLTPRSVVTDLAFKQNVRGTVTQNERAEALPSNVTARDGASSAPVARSASSPSGQIDMLKLATAITTPIPAPRERSAAGKTAGREPIKATRLSTATDGGPDRTARARAAKGTAATAQEQAELDYRRGVALANQGRLAEGVEALRSALVVDALHEPARQSLVSMLIDQRRFDDALQALRQGLDLNPRNSAFATLMARVLVERRELDAALGVLRKFSPAGGTVEHYALAGALLQRLGRNSDAIEEYQSAIRLAPQGGAQTGVLLVGLAISQEGAGRRAEALETYRRARASGNLSTELAAFIDQQLRTSQ